MRGSSRKPRNLLLALCSLAAAIHCVNAPAAAADMFLPKTAQWAGNPFDATVVRWRADTRSQLLVVRASAYTSPDSATLFDVDDEGALTPVWEILVPDGPTQVRTGDLNGDSIDDAVITSVYDTVTVLFGNIGALPTVAKYYVPFHPISVAIADFNADGANDLAIGQANWVRVLLNDGAGVFRFAYRHAPGGQFSSLATADFNLDGYLDIVAANIYAPALQLLFGDGAGQFDAVRWEAQNSSVLFAAGDFTGDGIDDVIAKQYYHSVISLFRGHGDGTFDDPIDTFVSTGAVWMDTADFDRDGDLDVVVGSGSGRIAVLMNNGHGAFSHEHTLEGAGYEAAVRAQDVNSDGWIDLTVCTRYDDSVYVFLNRGNATTAVLAGPPTATFMDGGVEVVWPLGEIPVSAAAERFDPINGAWASFDGPLMHERDALRLDDQEIVRGRRYGYRLVGSDGTTFGEVWIDVPGSELRVLVAPNPAMGPVVVRVPGVTSSAELTIFDLAGRRVLSKKLDASAAVRGVTIHRSAGLRPGIYRLRVTSGHESAESKLVVLR